MHWVNADEPEECQWGFIDFVSLLAGAAGGCMRTWADFTETASHVPVYENYRRLIKLLLWKNPPPQDGFLVLKAPQVTPHLAEFAQVFPEARFVAPARDPYRVVSSGRAMVGGIVEAFLAEGVDPPPSYTLESLRPTLRSMLDFASSMLVIPYEDLVSDPATTAVAVYERPGLPTDPELATKIGALLDAQRQGGRVRPPSTLPEPELTQDEMHRDPTVAEFCEVFGVHAERDRLTGAHP